MKLLAIDSSSIVATAALVDEEKIMGEMIINHKKNHSKKLMPLIKDLLDELEVDIKDVDAFGVSIGPGSFTGIRIGVSTIKALAQIDHKPVVGISTLEGLAYNLPHCNSLVCPILDAQRNQVYTALYKWENGQMKKVLKERAIGIEEWIEELRKFNQDIYLIGDGIDKFSPNLMAALGDRISLAPITTRMARASSIGALAIEKIQGGQASDYKALVPEYIRKSHAQQKFGL